MSNFFSCRFWHNACAMLSIRNTRSAMGSAGALLPCLCGPSSPSPCVSLWWNRNKSLSDRGNSQHLHRHQTNGATNSFAKKLTKIGLGFLLMVSRQNTHLPTTTPRRQQCLRCLSFEMTFSAWAAVGRTGARPAHVGIRLEQALLWYSILNKHVRNHGTDERKEQSLAKPSNL